MYSRHELFLRSLECYNSLVTTETIRHSGTYITLYVFAM